MVNFSIQFSNPWFLLLLIPALFLALLPYFRMNKRYRKTRNRIASIALHITVMVLSICVLAGITFEYDLPNKENEVILLVDTSDSGSEDMEDKNDFVKSVIDNTEVQFTELASGVPLGGDLDYLDDGTLTLAFGGRKSL